MCVGRTSYHCSRRLSESWKGERIIPLAHSFRVFFHGEQSLSVWGWSKAWDLAHVLEHGIFPQSMRTETREDPRTDIQLKAPSWYPTSATRTHLIKFSPPSEDWVSNTWMPVRNISHITLDITSPNMFIDILGVMMLPYDPWWLPEPCRVWSSLCCFPLPCWRAFLQHDLVLLPVYGWLWNHSRNQPTTSPSHSEKLLWNV